MDFSILLYLALGLSAGAIAKYALPGKEPGGLLITMLLGVAGSMLGGKIGGYFGVGGTGIDLTGLLTAVGGAILLLMAYRKITVKG